MLHLAVNLLRWLILNASALEENFMQMRRADASFENMLVT
jgi:hypothetical protein